MTFRSLLARWLTPKPETAWPDECPASNVRAFADELAEQRRIESIEEQIAAGIARCREQRRKRSAAARKGIENARRKQGEN